MDQRPLARDMRATYLDRAGVYDSLLAPETLCDGVLCDYSLACAGVCRDENRLVPLDSMYGDLLEGIQLEWIRACRIGIWNMGRNGDIAIAWGDSYLMSNLRGTTSQ